MGLFDRAIARAKEGLAQGRKIKTQFTNAAYLDRAMAVGFLMGGADGEFDPDERAGLVTYIESDATLSAFGSDAITESFNKVEGNYNLTVALGNKKALRILEGVTNPDEKAGLMELAATLATLDGDVGDEERAMLQRIADVLGENVADYEDLLEV